MDSFANFDMLGRIQSIKKTVIKANNEPMLQVRIILKNNKTVTTLAFGGLVDEIISDADSLPISYGSNKNPWAIIQGVVSEKYYKEDEKKISETTLIARKVFLFYPASQSKNSAENLDRMIEEINSSNNKLAEKGTEY